MSINSNGSIRSIALIDTSTMWRMAFLFFEILKITKLEYTLPAIEQVNFKPKFLYKFADARVQFVTFFLIITKRWIF